jgi:hypothetical protein
MYEENEANQVTTRTYVFDTEALSVDIDLADYSFHGGGGRRIPPVASLARQ